MFRKVTHIQSLSIYLFIPNRTFLYTMINPAFWHYGSSLWSITEHFQYRGRCVLWSNPKVSYRSSTFPAVGSSRHSLSPPESSAGHSLTWALPACHLLLSNRCLSSAEGRGWDQWYNHRFCSSLVKATGLEQGLPT